jgi:hypothetical protein
VAEDYKDLNELMESIDTATVRTDIVYTLLIKAWDLGFCEGCEEAQEQIRAHAEY